MKIIKLSSLVLIGVVLVAIVIAITFYKNKSTDNSAKDRANLDAICSIAISDWANSSKIYLYDIKSRDTERVFRKYYLEFVKGGLAVENAFYTSESEDVSLINTIKKEDIGTEERLVSFGFKEISADALCQITSNSIVVINKEMLLNSLSIYD